MVEVIYYLEDGTKWKGVRHSMFNSVMYSEKTHTKKSKKLYHFRQLSKAIQIKLNKKNEK